MSLVTYDILIHILEYLRDDYPSLSRMSRASRAFREPAAKLLYERVTLSPPYMRTLSLQRKDEFAESMLSPASLPHNAPFVLRLELSGFLSPRPYPVNRISQHLVEALQLWINLHTVVFTPLDYPDDLFTDVLPLLRHGTHLRHLSVNESCTDSIRAPSLILIEGLESLTLTGPGRAILNLLPEWLSRLSPTLRALHLMENCGSVTPGVLRSLFPHLQAIRSFSLGLSYSLTDDDVFEFSNQLPDLRSLHIRYYLQLREPSVLAKLSALQSLTVEYTDITTREDVAYLCKWIRRAITHAPLEQLHLLTEEFSRDSPSVSYDSLASHLAQKHTGALRVLRMDAAFVGRDALKELCARCTRLEVLGVAVSGNLLPELPNLLKPLHRLHTVYVQTRNARQSRVSVDVDKARELITHGPASLRRLVVNGMGWEGRWVSTPSGEVQAQFFAERM